MVASRALAKLRKSKSGGQGSEIEDLSKETDKQMVASRALAKLRKSGSRGQGSEIDVLVTVINKTASRAWPNHGNLDLEVRALTLMF